ncbi:hypothetical protein ACTU45_18525 [Streptomyces sp. 24-1644]|uniref:hypothetical protein n=1 Tax=Streptomyces sp. 24-1644 TaxID=3457315 RepID=UPI003FA7BCAC
MPENTVTTPLAPMDPQDVADSFAYVRALQADDIDTACAVANDSGQELHRLLLDVATRVIIPITAVDDHDEEPCAHSFLAAGLGRHLLELLCHGVCLANAPGAQTIIRFTDNILTEDHGDVADVLRQLEAAGMKQAMEAHRTTAPPRRPPHHRCTAAPPHPSWCVPPASPHAPGARHGRAGSSITHPLDRDLIASRNRLCQGETSSVVDLAKGVQRSWTRGCSGAGQGVTRAPAAPGQGVDRRWAHRRGADTGCGVPGARELPGIGGVHRHPAHQS